MAQMIRDAAGKRVGTITHVGLSTYVDPRIEGAKVNSKTTEDIVKLIEIEGEEKTSLQISATGCNLYPWYIRR